MLELNLIPSSRVAFDTAIEFVLCAKTFPPNRITAWDCSSHSDFPANDFKTVILKVDSMKQGQGFPVVTLKTNI